MFVGNTGWQEMKTTYRGLQVWIGRAVSVIYSKFGGSFRESFESTSREKKND